MTSLFTSPIYEASFVELYRLRSAVYIDLSQQSLHSSDGSISRLQIRCDIDIFRTK